MVIKTDRKQLEFFANDLSIEVDPKDKDESLYDEVIKALDVLTDDEWDALNEKTQEWSNELNQARLAARKGSKTEKPEKEEESETKSEKASKEAQEVPEKAKNKDKGKANGKEKFAKKDAAKEPTKKELDAAKAKAKEKAKTVFSESKKQTTNDKPYNDGTTAWHVWMTVVDAGKKGITAEAALPEFEKRIKAAGLETSNAKSRVNTILRQCVDPKGLVDVKDGVYTSTKKSAEAIKQASKTKKEKE